MARRVNIGLTLSNRGPLIFPEKMTVNLLLKLAEKVEDDGYDSLWVGDSILAKPRLESVAVLSAIAARTKRVKLGVGCLASFPLRNPIMLAHAWATLDQLSSGRTILAACMGGGSREAGGDFAREFEALNVPYEKRAGLLEEGVEVIRRLWAEDGVSHSGEFYRFRDVTLVPKPVQKPSPPIWIVSNPYPFKTPPRAVERAFRRVVRLGDGWMTTLATPQQFEESWKRIQEYAREGGRDPAQLHPALYYNININPDRERAYTESKLFLDRYYMTDYPREVVEMWVALGTPQQCISRLEQYIAAGARTITLRLTSLDQAGQLEKCTREILSVF